MYNKQCPILYVVVPCYNEEEVLPVTGKLFLDKIKELKEKKLVSKDSKVVFVNDGSKDNTWSIICKLSEECQEIEGITLSRNRGHQNAVLAALMEVILPLPLIVMAKMTSTPWIRW